MQWHSRMHICAFIHSSLAAAANMTPLLDEAQLCTGTRECIFVFVLAFASAYLYLTAADGAQVAAAVGARGGATFV